MENQTEAQRFYALRDAAYADLAAARELIENDASIVAAKNSIGETALHFLAIENALEAVKLLAQNGADVNNRNAFGTPAIIEAAEVGHLEMVDLLLELGADADLQRIAADLPDIGEAERTHILELLRERLAKRRS